MFRRRRKTEKLLYGHVNLKGEAAKMRPPETLNCFKSKTCKGKKLKLYQSVYLISQTGWGSFSFLALHVLNLE